MSRAKKMGKSPYRAGLETDDIPCIISSKILRVVQEAKPIHGDSEACTAGDSPKRCHNPSGEDSEKNNLGVN
jgi:hypothetical protein